MWRQLSIIVEHLRSILIHFRSSKQFGAYCIYYVTYMRVFLSILLAVLHPNLVWLCFCWNWKEKLEITLILSDIYFPQNKAIDNEGQFYGQFYIQTWSCYVFVGIKNNINVISNFFRTSEENLPNLKRGRSWG